MNVWLIELFNCLLLLLLLLLLFVVAYFYILLYTFSYILKASAVLSRYVIFAPAGRMQRG